MKCIIICLFLTIVTMTMSCEVPCTKEMNPVCATDGLNLQEFSNECMMNNQRCIDGKGWRSTGFRSCNMVKNEPLDKYLDCFKVCSMLVMPVCGYGGTTYQLFGNECTMSNRNCILGGENAYKTVDFNKCSDLMKRRNYV